MINKRFNAIVGEAANCMEKISAKLDSEWNSHEEKKQQVEKKQDVIIK